jgi:integrase
MKVPSIKIVHNRLNKKNKSGMYPVHLRITLDRVTKYVLIPTPTKISMADWNKKHNGENYIKNTHPFAFEINEKIRNYKRKVNDVISRHYSQNKTITFDALLKGLNKKGESQIFNHYCKDYIDNPKEVFSAATITKYRTYLKHLNEFNPTIYFRDLTPELVSDFKTYLEVKLGLGGGTIKSYFDKFKKIITAAEREAFLDYSQTRFLFSDSKISVPKPKRLFLEATEIANIKSLKFSKDEKHLERDRDLFLFQIYTGYYYKDLRIIKKNHVVDDPKHGKIILGERNKNGQPTIIPLYKFNNAVEIIKNYAADNDSEYLFNESIFIEDQVFNRQLKEIAKRAGISKNISNKTARHTNAQLWIRHGAEASILSKMLGHGKEQTTGEYYTVDILDVVENISGINFNELGI